MPVIHLITEVAAPAVRCFDLSRSIDLHQRSTASTGEKAVAGVTFGLINLHEEVTWRAKHLGVWQNLTSRITACDSPTYFVDEMVRGAFKRFKHEHVFEEEGNITIMHDIFDYTSPLGILGRVADALFLKQYMTKFLYHRNQVIKEYAETELWRQVLPSE